MKILLCFIFIFSSINFASDLEIKLKTIAEIDGFGYKTANLLELSNYLLRRHDTKNPYKVAVPTFYGLPTKSIENFIFQNGNFDIKYQWSNLIKKYFSDEENKIMTLKNGFSPDFLKTCEQFRQDLNQAFDKANDILINKDMSLDIAFDKAGIDTWLKELSHDRLMVRSTGKEDTVELANAGGNESIANVSSTKKDIVSAIKEVVISYFGEKSLQQRLSAQDKSLFSPVSFTPVLLQKMIGEDNNQIPKCGVMFTEEPEGGISPYDYKDKHGNILTTGITIIQAAYGHNEAVVNSIIPVDTYYVNADKNIYPIIRAKTHRMVPNRLSVGLSLIKNDASLIKKSTLNKAAIITLKSLADGLESFYGRPMDVEYVISESEKTIYLVQARPLTHAKNSLPPSYFIDASLPKASYIYQGEAIGVAGGSIRICRDPKEIIIASTINQALTIYQNDRKHKDIVQCVIIGKPAPRTSHEATQFRSEGKAVIYLSDWQKLKASFEQNHLALVVSPQQGIVALWSDLTVSVDKLIDAKLATKGWSTYPIEAMLSLHPDLKGFAVAKKAIVSDSKTIITPQFSRWFEIIKKGSVDEAQKALSSLMQYAHGIFSIYIKKLSLDEVTQALLDNYMSYLFICMKDIENNISYLPDDAINYSKRLFSIRILENLIFQQVDYDAISYGHSLVVWTKTFKDEQAIIKDLSKQQIDLDSRAIQYMRLSSLAMTPELKNNIEDFLINFSKKYHKDTINRAIFENIIFRLKKLGVLSLWLHTSFAREYKNNSKDVSLIFENLMMRFNETKDFIDGLASYREAMIAFNENTAFLAEKHFSKRWKEFKDNFFDYFLSSQFLDSFKTANELGKLSALQVMSQLVDKFDGSVKAISGNGKYNVLAKASNMQTMLFEYANLFETWASLIDNKNTFGPYGPRYCLENNSMCGIRDILKIAPAEHMLKSTPYFNVAAFALSANAGWSQIEPKPSTYEDVFTLTHQSLLNVISILNQETGLNTISLPELLMNAEKSLKQLEKILNGKFQPIGAYIHDSTLNKLYNLPLNYHSAQFELKYNKKTDKISILVKFYGHGGRWVEIADFVWLMGQTQFLSVNNIELLPLSGVTLEFTVKNQQEIAILVEVLAACIRRTVSTDIDYQKFLLPTQHRFSLFKDILEKYKLLNLLDANYNFSYSDIKILLDEMDVLQKGYSNPTKAISQVFYHVLSHDFHSIKPLVSRLLGRYNYLQDQYPEQLIAILAMVAKYDRTLWRDEYEKFSDDFIRKTISQKPVLTELTILKKYSEYLLAQTINGNQDAKKLSYTFIQNVKRAELFPEIGDLAIELWKQGFIGGIIQLFNLTDMKSVIYSCDMAKKLINNGIKNHEKIYEIILNKYLNSERVSSVLAYLDVFIVLAKAGFPVDGNSLKNHNNFATWTNRSYFYRDSSYEQIANKVEEVKQVLQTTFPLKQ